MKHESEDADRPLEGKLVPSWQRASAESLRCVVEHGAQGTLIVSEHGVVRYANPAALEILGQQRKELTGSPLELSLKNGTGGLREVTRPDGQTLTVSIREVEVEWDGSVARLVTLTDVTEQQQLRRTNHRLEQMVHLDPLTGVLNRRGLARVLDAAVLRRRRGGEGLMVLLLDLDDFKSVNDEFGHDVGDLVLQHVARTLRGALRGSDQPARVGGDEFLVLLTDTRAAEGVRVAEKICVALQSSPLDVAGHSVRVTASIGVAALDSPTGIDELLTQTHHALAASKRAGKNRVATNDTTLDTQREQLVARLQHDDCLRTRVLPIRSLPDGEPVAFEFLSRSTLPVFERPTDFFALCACEDVLADVDRRCMRRCAAAARKHTGPGGRYINVFPSTLLTGDVSELLELLAPTDAHEWCLEISEQQIVGDPGRLLEAIGIIKAAGVQLALDDLGFGRSCLESLVLLEPDVVKIERRFVAGIDTEPARRRSLARLLAVVQSLDCKVIAESIETQSECLALSELGVTLGQGHRWGRPQPV